MPSIGDAVSINVQSEEVESRRRESVLGGIISESVERSRIHETKEMETNVAVHGRNERLPGHKRNSAVPSCYNTTDEARGHGSK